MKPANGYIFLEDVKIGELVETQGLSRAIVLNKSPSSVTVLVTDSPSTQDKQYYIGKHIWASKTEVKINE